jgi:hypothetical protein
MVRQGDGDAFFQGFHALRVRRAGKRTASQRDCEEDGSEPLHSLGWAFDVPSAGLSKSEQRDLKFILTDLRQAGLLTYVEDGHQPTFHVVRHPDHAQRFEQFYWDVMAGVIPPSCSAASASSPFHAKASAVPARAVLSATRGPGAQRLDGAGVPSPARVRANCPSRQSGLSCSRMSRGVDGARLTLSLVSVATIIFVYGGWLHVANATTVSMTLLMVVLVVAATSRLWIAVITSLVAVLDLISTSFPVGTLTTQTRRTGSRCLLSSR